MTTITIVLGEPETGKRLVGSAIAQYINRGPECALAIVEEKSADLLAEAKLLIGGFDDIILISGIDQIEDWMKPWIEAYGEPLFTIRIERNKR